MAAQKVEFELLVTTTKADNSVLGVERKIISLSSNLKDSLNKLEVFKKALENTGNKMPALELLQKFKEELLAATRQTQSLDATTKKLVQEHIASLKQTNLPPKLSNQLQPASRQGTPLGVGELTPKKLTALEEFYKNLPAYATAGLSKKLRKELDEALKNASLNLTVKQPPQPLVSRDILKASWDQSLKDRFKEIASIPNVRPYQRPDEAATANFKDRYAPYQGFKGVVSIADRAMQTNIAAKQREVEAFQTYKPLTFVQKETARLNTLQEQLFKIPQNERLGEFWAKTAKQILDAQAALAKFAATEKSLKFQKGLNDSVLPFGQKQLAAGRFEAQYPAKVGQLSARAAQEADNALAKVEKRFNNLIQSTAGKIDGTTDKAERTALLRRMQELGKGFQSELGNTQLINQTKGLTASYRDALAVLKEQNSQTSSLKTKNKELLGILDKIRQSNLSNQTARGLIAEVQAAKRALDELDKAQQKVKSNSGKNLGLTQKGQGLLSSIDYNQQLSIVQGKYGANSLQAINLSEQQKLAELRARAERNLGKAQEKLNSSTTDAGREKIERRMQNIASAYDKATGAVVQHSSAMRASSLATQAHLAASNNLLVRIGEYVIGYKAVNAVVDGFGSVLRNIPDAGIKLENTKAVLQAMYVTTKDVNEQFSFLDSVADRTGGRLRILRTEFGDFSASAMAAGEAVTNIQESFANLADVSTVLHLPEEKVHGALVAISQMYAKNQVMAEELKRQLGNVLPGSVAMFARSQDMSTRELLNAMKQGLVRPKEAVPQFLQFYKQVFAPKEAFDTASQGLYANLGRLENEYTRLSEALYKKSSGALLGFTKAGTEGLKGVRENLDGILVVMRDIAAVALVAGGAGLFKMALNRSAVGAIGVINRRDAATGFMESAGTKLPSATNPSDVALYATAANFLPNILKILKEAILNLNPVVKGAIVGITGLELAWQGLNSLPTIKLDDKIEISVTDVLLDRLENFKKDFKQFQKDFGYLDTYDPVGKVKAEASKEVFASIAQFYVDSQMDAEERAALLKQKIREKDEAAYKVYKENMLAESKKLLLAEPTNLIETTLDPKAFTRSIELIGRAVQLQITSITQQANAQIATLEASLTRLGRKNQLGLISTEELFRQKKAVLAETLNINQGTQRTTAQLNQIPLKMSADFAQSNEQTASFDRKIESLSDRLADMTVALNSNYALKLKDGTTKTFGEMGFILNTDPAKGKVLSKSEQDERVNSVIKERELYLKTLAENADENPGVKFKFSNLPIKYIDTEKKQLEDELVSLRERKADLQTKLHNLQLFYAEEASKAETGVGGNNSIIDLLKGKVSSFTANQIEKESAWNPEAVSPKGAVGLMQVMPSTAAKPGYNVPDLFQFADKLGIEYVSKAKSEVERLLKNPTLNITFGEAYREGLLQNYGGDKAKANAAYNAGTKAVDKYGADVPYAETQDYQKTLLPKWLEASPEDRIANLATNLTNTKSLDKKFQIPATQASAQSFRAIEAQISAQNAQKASEDKYKVDKENLLFDESMAFREQTRNFQSSIAIPFIKATNPLSFEGTKQDLLLGQEPLRNLLKASLNEPEAGRQSGTTEQLTGLIQQLDSLNKLQEEAFYRDQRTTARAEDLKTSELVGQRNQDNIAYQLRDSNFEQLVGSTTSARLRGQILASQQGQVTNDILADPTKLPKQKQNALLEFLNQVNAINVQLANAESYLKDNLFQQIDLPYSQLEGKDARNSLQEQLRLQWKPIENSLKTELARPMAERTIKDTKFIEDSLGKINTIVSKTLTLYDRNLEVTKNETSIQLLNTKAQSFRSTYAYQSAAPLEQVVYDSSQAKEELLRKQSGREAFVSKQNADVGVNGFTLEQSQQAIAEYDAAITDLQTRAEGVSNFFNSTLADSMRSPILALVTGASSMEKTLKSFGYNVFSKIADNIIASMSNSLADLVMAAGSATGGSAGGSGIWGTIISGIFGGLTGGGGGAASSVASSGLTGSTSQAFTNYGSSWGSGFTYRASGGSIDSPKVFTQTQRVQGKGTGTSDSITGIAETGAFVLKESVARNVKLSNGELYISPKDVERIGLPKLQALNDGETFAKGGEIGGNSTSIASKANVDKQKDNSSATYMTFEAITINMESSGDPKKDGEAAATSFIEQIATATAAKVSKQTLGAHIKHQHKGTY